MNVKCPYCGCVYDINCDLLKNPIGSEKLGYGWWLRCYKCQKKWWLKNSTVEASMNAPLIANRQSKIDKISKLKGNHRTRPTKKRNNLKIVKYIVLASIIVFIGIAFYNKEIFYDYLLAKAKHLSTSMARNLTMNDVKYFIEDDNDAAKITVSGKIINEDRLVAKLKGVKISIYDSSGKEIKSWSSELKYGYIVSGDTMDFSTSEKLPKRDENIRVDVSIF